MAEDAAGAGYVVRAGDEGEHRWFAGGGLHVWKARAADTGGAFNAFVDHLTRGKMTPLHMHPDADDSMYVIEGEVTYYVDGQTHILGPGSFASALRGTPHAFMVTSETAKVLAFQTPGASEVFYLDASDPLEEAAAGDGNGVDLPRLQQSAATHESAVRFLGPPPFERLPV